MSRLNSKLVLKALSEVPGDEDDDRKFEVVKVTNTLNHGIPGDILYRAEVDAILRNAESRGARNTLTVEFVK